MWVEVVASTLAGAPRSPSPHRTHTVGYPNQRAHPCAHQEHARTLTHSTDRNDTPGLAYLARTGFFKPVHMKSLSAHALRSLIIARKKTGGPASDLGESDLRFGGCVREHNPSIPVARCAQIAVIVKRCGERVKSDRLFKQGSGAQLSAGLFGETGRAGRSDPPNPAAISVPSPVRFSSLSLRSAGAPTLRSTVALRVSSRVDQPTETRAARRYPFVDRSIPRDRSRFY